MKELIAAPSCPTQFQAEQVEKPNSEKDQQATKQVEVEHESSCKSIVPHEDEDLAKDFVQDAGFQAVCTNAPQAKAKDRFLRCTLTVPAIALKKMIMALQADRSRADGYVSVLGLGSHKMHKQTRPSLVSMYMGDYLANRENFWVGAQSQLKDKKIGAVMVFDSSEINVEEASHLIVLAFFCVCVLDLSHYIVIVYVCNQFQQQHYLRDLIGGLAPLLEKANGFTTDYVSIPSVFMWVKPCKA